MGATRDRRALRRQRVAGAGVGELGHGGQVAGHDLGDRCLVLAPQREQAVQPLGGARRGVDELVVGPDRARQHLEQRELADVGVGDGLEHEGQGLARRVGLRPRSRCRRPRTVTGGRSAGDGPISQMKSARRSTPTPVTAEPHTTGNTVAVGDAVGERVLQLGDARDVALEVALHQLVVGHHDALDEVVVHLVLEVGEVVGDRLGRCGCRRRRR